jgi:hypothetical protein
MLFGGVHGRGARGNGPNPAFVLAFLNLFFLVSRAQGNALTVSEVVRVNFAYLVVFYTLSCTLARFSGIGA